MEAAISLPMLALRIGLTAIAVALAYVSGTAAAWNNGLPGHAYSLPPLISDDPDIVMTRVIEELRISGGQFSPDSLNSVRRAARLDPLEDEPFLILGLREITFGRHVAAISLLETAKRRNLRQPETRNLLLNEYARAGNGAAAIEETRALSELMPEARPQLIKLLINLAARPETREATLVELPSHPLRLELLQELARAGASPFMLLEIAGDLRGTAANGGDTRRIDDLTQHFVERGDIEGARMLWKHFYAVDSTTSTAGVFDGDFDGLAGPPFGWKITGGKAGLAELRDGTLFIQHFGRDNIDFARELVTLPPGAYELDFEGEHGQEVPANLVWRIACLESGATLLDLSLNPSSLFGGDQFRNFAVPPAHCSGQWIALTGRPTEFQDTRTFTITKVSIEPTGAQ